MSLVIARLLELVSDRAENDHREISKRSDKMRAVGELIAGVREALASMVEPGHLDDGA